ncbi:MAG: glycosyltransferase family 39 protein [Streptosporangiaceae bacterium]|jgi:4-amino-4-deoxy-L-arabinose transferase-like glycosyltransferase
MDGASRTWVDRLPLIVLAVLAAGFLALGVAEAWADAPTFDEPVYVSAGLAAVLHHDVTLNDEHPPLPKILAVLPVLFTHPVGPANGRWSGNDELRYGARFTAAQLAAGKLRSVTFAARLVPLAETAAVAFVLFGVAGELAGPVAGGLAGALWLASPLVLGLGHLDGTDVPFALGVTLSSWALLRWLRRRDTRTLAGLGLGLAAAAETQVTGLLVVAAALAVVIGAQWRSGVVRAFAQAGLAGLIAWAVVWAVYIAIDPAMVWQLPTLVPRPYLDGIRYLAAHDTTSSAAYVDGIAYTGGRWWFWPLSLVIKWPLTALPLLVAGAIGCLRLPRGPRWRAGVAVGLPAVLLTAFTLTMPKDVGVRYLLPVLALWAAAAASGIVAVLGAVSGTARKRLAGAVVAVLLGTAVLSTATSFPRSLAWTAWPFRPGYAVATDSDVDWGQGLYALRAWSAGRDPWVAYFGPRGIAASGIPGARPLLGAAPARVDGWVAASVTALNSANRPALSWLRAWCPVAILDGTILVYHFRQPPAAVVTGPAPARPAALCPGQWSSIR